MTRRCSGGQCSTSTVLAEEASWFGGRYGVEVARDSSSATIDGFGKAVACATAWGSGRVGERGTGFWESAFHRHGALGGRGTHAEGTDGDGGGHAVRVGALAWAGLLGLVGLWAGVGE